MRYFVALFAALLGSIAMAQQTVTIPAQTVTVTVPAQVVTIPAQTVVVDLPAQTLTVSGTTVPPVTCVAPQVLQGGVCVSPVTPPPAGTAWVFHNGTTGPLFGGDYSYGSGSVSYKTKDPVTGEGVIGVTGDEGLQPYFVNNDFDTTGYNYVLVSLKPTAAGQTWITGMESVGDVPVPGSGSPPSIAQYCAPAFSPGVWSVCKIPLTAYNIGPTTNLGLHIYKVMFQNQGTAPKGKLNWEAKEIGISP